MGIRIFIVGASGNLPFRGFKKLLAITIDNSNIFLYIALRNLTTSPGLFNSGCGYRIRTSDSILQYIYLAVFLSLGNNGHGIMENAFETSLGARGSGGMSWF